MTHFQWLSDAAQVVNALAVVVLVAVTIWYAWTTKKILNESAKMRGLVEKQADDERKERLRQEADQRKAIAAALVLEIEGFEKHYLDYLWAEAANPTDQWRQADWCHKLDQLVLKPPPTAAFPIYRANAGRIGEFRRDEVEPVVRFYNAAESFLTSLEQAIESKKSLVGPATMGANYLASESAKILFAATSETHDLADSAMWALKEPAEQSVA